MRLAQQTLYLPLLLVVCTLAKDLDENIRNNNDVHLRGIQSASIRLTIPLEDANLERPSSLRKQFAENNNYNTSTFDISQRPAGEDAIRILQGGYNHGSEGGDTNHLLCGHHGTYITSTKSCVCDEGYYGDECETDSTGSLVSAQKSSKLFILYIVISIVGLLLVLSGIFLVIRYKRNKRHAQELALVRGSAEVQANAQQQRPLVIQQSASNVALLTREEFMKYFPKRKFENLKSSFPQASCSICLDDFTAEIHCRQLYCEHLFHSRCIGSWLSRHNSCPNCKKEMTKVAIDEFLTCQQLTSEVKIKAVGKKSVYLAAKNTETINAADVPQQNPVVSDDEQESLVEVGHPIQESSLNVEIRPSGRYRLNEIQIEIQNRRSKTQVPAQSQTNGNQNDINSENANRNDA